MNLQQIKQELKEMVKHMEDSSRLIHETSNECILKLTKDRIYLKQLLSEIELSENEILKEQSERC